MFHLTYQFALLLPGLGHGREVLRRRGGEALVLCLNINYVINELLKIVLECH